MIDYTHISTANDDRAIQEKLQELGSLGWECFQIERREHTAILWCNRSVLVPLGLSITQIERGKQWHARSYGLSYNRAVSKFHTAMAQRDYYNASFWYGVVSAINHKTG